MPIYRFTGRQANVPKYNLPKEKKPYTEIRTCDTNSYIIDSASSPNIYDRALIRYISTNQFVLDTFSKLILYPINLDTMCGNHFKDRDIVAVEAEDVSDKIEPIMANTIPVKIFTIKRTSKMLIHDATGIIKISTDSNGMQYYLLVEKTDLTITDPYFKLTQNKLLFNNIVINYEVVNIMGLTEPITNLLNKKITVSYVDYGKETKERLGLPIVIFNYKIIQ